MTFCYNLSSCHFVNPAFKYAIQIMLIVFRLFKLVPYFILVKPDPKLILAGSLGIIQIIRALLHSAPTHHTHNQRLKADIQQLEHADTHLYFSHFTILTNLTIT